jgi:hypothetical protein
LTKLRLIPAFAIALAVSAQAMAGGAPVGAALPINDPAAAAPAIGKPSAAALPVGKPPSPASAASAAAGSPCVPGATTLCIDDAPGDRRWRLTVAFHTAEGGGFSGSGTAIPLAGLGVAEGGLFWFFNGDNPEILIKVLNACAVNQRFWVFYAATTNVGFTIDVEDTRTQRTRTYTNLDGTAAPPVQDTAAFACTGGDAPAALSPAAVESLSTRPPAPAPPSTPPATRQAGPAPRLTAAGCAAGATTLCIDGRFQVQASFHTAQGGGFSGSGQAIGLESAGVSRGGLLWFFDATNPEILVKVLDGCAVNGRFWVFYAAGTNVAFTVAVTDTQTGSSSTYQNADLVAAAPVQDTAALPCAGGPILYVATDGSDAWSGTLPAPNASRTDGPFASLARAQQAERSLGQTKGATVEVRGGTYYLPLSPTNPGTLTFGPADSGSAGLPVTWKNYPGEMPIVSGGVPVGGGGLGLTWTRSGGGNLWQVTLPAALQPFATLYYATQGSSPGAGQRRLRARAESPNGVGYAMIGGQCTAVSPLGPPSAVPIALCNLGTFLRVAASIPQSASTCTVANSMSDGRGNTKCLDRFVYNPADPVIHWLNLNGSYTGNPASPCRPDPANPYPAGDVELTLFEAWTVDAMRIGCIDTANHVVYLTGPAKKNGAMI